MSNRGIHAIMELLEGRDAITMEIADLMAEEGFAAPQEDFTYTTRYSIPVKDRERITRAVRERCKRTGRPEDAERFLAVMEKYQWDVSFLVDGF